MIGFVRALYTDPDCQKQYQALKDMDCLIVLQGSLTPEDSQVDMQKVVKTILPKETLVISKLSILGNSLQEARKNLMILQSHDISVIMIREQLKLDSHEIKNMTELLSVLEDFQSDVHSENTRKGMKESKEKGIKIGRPKKHEKAIEEALSLYQSKSMGLDEIQDRTGISRSTLYRYLQQS